MANKWLSKIGCRPSFVFWASLAVATLLCAIFGDAWWHYFSAGFCTLLAILSWNDKITIDD